jgi:Arc/MetJ-type ribon-helix-helix transcriptional regulator
MKVKTSVSLSEELLAEIDREAGRGGRSELVETALVRHLREVRRARRHVSEKEALERLLNSPDFESDALEYGVDPFELGDDVEVLSADAPGQRAS